MRRPRVSILTPTYNHAPYLDACLRSALDQTMADWEMVVVDDGSTDATPEILARVRDPRIAVVRRPHGGPTALGEAYNLALGKTSSDLITVLEGDDFWPRDRLERQLAEFGDVVLSHGSATILRGDVETVVPSPFRDPIRTNDPVGTSLAAFLVGFNPVWAQTVMVRRAALETIGGFRQPAGLPLVDYPTWMELALLGRFHYIGGPPLGTWRRHPTSITSNYLRQLHEGFARCCEAFAREHALDGLPIPWREIRRSLGVYSFFGLAQWSLEHGEFAAARGAFIETLRRRAVVNRSVRLHALTGIVSSFVRRDLYPMLRDVRAALTGRRLVPASVTEPIAFRW